MNTLVKVLEMNGKTKTKLYKTVKAKSFPITAPITLTSENLAKDIAELNPKEVNSLKRMNFDWVTKRQIEDALHAIGSEKPKKTLRGRERY